MRKSASPGAGAYYAATSPRYSSIVPPSRPSMSSDRYSVKTASPTAKHQKRQSRREMDHQSIMSSRASETSQATRTSKLRKRERAPPPPPPKDIKFTSFTPAMTEAEDARSEMLAIKSKLRLGLSKIVRVFIPKTSKSHSKLQSSTSSPNSSFESSEAYRYNRWWFLRLADDGLK